MNRFLGNLKKRILVACLSASFLLSSVAAAAFPEIITLGELRPGMWGTGYTVIDASGDIKPFEVEVVGILGDDGKMSAKRILVNLYGSVIDETGGAVSGMSGSPIYFDGRLAGALSAGYKDMYPTQRIMLTPIEDMLKIWDYKDTRNQTRMPQVDLKQMQERAAKFKEKQAAEDAVTAESVLAEAESEHAAQTEAADEEITDEGTEDVVADAAESAEVSTEDAEASEIPADTELEEKTTYFASGYGSAGMRLLQDGMAKLGMNVNYDNTVDSGASNMQTNRNAVLYPGSPVGVAISVGDFTFGSMGTVTAVDGKKILAFGHSYTHRGNVNYFMTDAQVVSTIHGPTEGMKLGNVTGIIGRINQDRRDGVAGILGEMPQTMPVIVSVHDKDTGKNVTYNTMIAYDEEIIALLAPITVYSSIVNTLDRQDSSTADIKFSLRSNYGKNGVLERRNMFYDPADVAAASITELNDMLGVIMNNKEKEPDVLDLKVDVTVERGRKTATLVSAVPSKKEVLPGEKINVEATIKPYRGEKIKVSVPYTIPETQLPGEMGLDVHGGGMVNVAKLILEQQAAAEAGQNMDEEPPVSVQLEDMLAANSNNEIVIESTVVVPKTDAELKESIKQAKRLSEKLTKKNKPAEKKPADAKAPPVNKAATDYIIENIIHTSVKVIEP